MGCHAIRCAHNPQVPRFYEICDEMGMLVMDEIFDGWKQKAAEQETDAVSMSRFDGRGGFYLRLDLTFETHQRQAVFNSSYDNAMVRITARRNWQLVRDTPWYAGHFRWTGFDYLGEAGYVHGGWPFRAFMGGTLDLAGIKKDLFYLYQSQWTDEPMVHILPHWTHPRMAAGAPGTTVRAVVDDGGTTPMEMSERFGPEEGIYWGE